MRAPLVAAAALALGAFVLFGGPAQAQDPAGPAPPPVAMPAEWSTRAESVPIHYSIKAQLVETGFGDGVRIVGDETVFWRNTSHEPVKVLYLHTYANAFRNTRSTFLREGMRDGIELPDDMKFADMAMPSMSTVDGTVLTPEWVRPDDANPDDRTVLRVPLPVAVDRLGELGVKISFTLEMPRVLRRMGTHQGFVMAAQWYPKLGMYVGREAAAKNVHEGWYCHQFHANCEFAADFADYDVNLTFPPQYKVGATGIPAGADAVNPKTGMKSRTYRAESVVDFAWTAGKHFIEIEREITPVDAQRPDEPVAAEWRRVKGLLARTDAEAALPAVRVVLLADPEHADQAERTFEAARVALGFFGTWLGPYPYGRLTIVDPPAGSESAGGMEYPMLVTAGTVAGSPAASQRPEGVTVHEICHQWLMGLLASNEAEEAWLDEGINTYLTSQAMHLTYGASQQMTEVLGFQLPFTPVYEFPGIAAGWPALFELPQWMRPPKIEALRAWVDLAPLSSVPAQRYSADWVLPLRRSAMRRSGYDEMVKSGWTYYDRTSYVVNAYSRPALFLSTLRRSLGAEFGAEEGERRFFNALRRYALAMRFRHPTTEDFLRKFKEFATDPAPLADQLIRSPSTLDYAIDSIRSGADPELFGVVDDKGTVRKQQQKDETAKDAAPAAKSSVVRVRRRGEAVVPITLEVWRDDDQRGKHERLTWDVKDQAKERWRDFVLPGTVVSVRLDPDGVYLQDGDLSNNTYSTVTNSRPAVKWSVRLLGWLENALVSYGRFF